jgi:hypothetical protein
MESACAERRPAGGRAASAESERARASEWSTHMETSEKPNVERYP